jgi:Papain family cysteine protease
MGVLSRLELDLRPPEVVERRADAELLVIPPDEFDFDPEISPEDRLAAEPIDGTLEAYEPYFATASLVPQWEGAASPAGLALPPDSIDRRPRQSAVRDQGNRRTCVAHAALACLEAGLKARAPIVLSPQYAHYKFMEFAGIPHAANEGIRTTDAAPYLRDPKGRVCREQYWRYVPTREQIAELVAAGDYGPPPAAVADQKYGLGAYKILEDRGLEDESIRNVRLLESLLAAGYDIVVGAWVAWDEDEHGIRRPGLFNGQPYYLAGHAMLIVGYDRRARFFWLKNSVGPGWGIGGYGRFSYEFAEMYFRYGWVAEAFVG